MSNKKYPLKIHQFILDNYKGKTTDELTNLVNERFGLEIDPKTIKSYKNNYHLWSGVDTRFKKGNIPYNLGKKGMKMHPNAVATQFKKGQKPLNTDPIGTVKLKHYGYYCKKIKETKPARLGWRPLHHLIWEDHNGKIPKGKVIVFIDQDKSNLDISNLAMISRKELAIINREFKLKNDLETNKALISLGRIKSRIFEVQ